MHVANTFRRCVAHLSDESFGLIFWIPLFVKVMKQMEQGEAVLIPWNWILGLWIARMTFEIICVYVLQALPAQYFLGLRIRSTYYPELGLSLSQCMVRVLFSQMKYLLGPAIYFMALFHRERQHLIDIIAETRVVQIQERVFLPKSRYLIGSILVYTSLYSSLQKSVYYFSEAKITKKGIYISSPQISLDL